MTDWWDNVASVSSSPRLGSEPSQRPYVLPTPSTLTFRPASSIKFLMYLAWHTMKTVGPAKCCNILLHQFHCAGARTIWETFNLVPVSVAWEILDCCPRHISGTSLLQLWHTGSVLCEYGNGSCTSVCTTLCNLNSTTHLLAATSCLLYTSRVTDGLGESENCAKSLSCTTYSKSVSWSRSEVSFSLLSHNLKSDALHLVPGAITLTLVFLA